MSTNTLKVAGFGSTACEFRAVGGESYRGISSILNSFVTLVVNTGACGLQTYLTPEEAEHLAGMLAQAALEVREQEQQRTLKEAA